MELTIVNNQYCSDKGLISFYIELRAEERSLESQSEQKKLF